MSVAQDTVGGIILPRPEAQAIEARAVFSQFKLNIAAGVYPLLVGDAARRRGVAALGADQDAVLKECAAAALHSADVLLAVAGAVVRPMPAS